MTENNQKTCQCDREMAESEQSSVWDVVIKQTKEAQEKGSDPLLWSMQVSSNLSSAGVCIPSMELANVLVSYICWENNVPILWKFLEKALVLNMVPSMLVLALLSSRVIPNRRVQPAAYRLYMELLKRHAFSLRSQINGPDYQKVMISIDAILNLSKIFGLQTSEAGTIVVGFIFSTVWQLLDASLDDEGLLELTPEKKSRWPTKPQDMEIDGSDNHFEKRIEHLERLQNHNTSMAIELFWQFLQNILTSKILNLAKRNMPIHWEAFIQQLHLLAENSSALKNSKVTSPEAILQLASDICITPQNSKLRSVQKCHSIMDSSEGLSRGIGRSTIWLPLDLVLEDAMNVTQVNATSSVEVITGLIKVLQAINCATWHDTFLGLWIAALRLVQRERDPLESPMPHLDSRLCMLLSVTPLVVAGLIEEDESGQVDKKEHSFVSHWRKQKVTGKSRDDLVSSLQMLGNFIGLLAPPRSAVSAANQAAVKAMFFISGAKVESAYLDYISTKDISSDFCGINVFLSVEACIARNLIDTSAYFWPGYVKGCINEIPREPAQVPGWSSLMQGLPLTPLLTNELVSTPAPSITELEKIFEVAINGSDADKISAVAILCGASLIQGWNIQEHTAHFVIRLLSPPCPANYSGSGSHLIGYAPLLNALVAGISSIDCIKILSQLGMVPQLACSLMTICEIFGSCVPSDSCSNTTGTETSDPHTVFSNGFTLLLKLWRFNYCFADQPGHVSTVRSNISPEYLLLVRNSHLASSANVHQDHNKRRLAAVASSSSAQPIFVDLFPKLKAWYMQHNACIASTLSGLPRGTPVHHHVDELLNMMFKEKEQGRKSAESNTSASGSSSKEANEHTFLSKLPAWDILAAVPFVADAALTACANGILSPRKLATGLKVLVDFLPASVATIVSYFSAEVTRGVWKPAFMNGKDWPSPNANLSNVVEKIKEIIAATAVEVSSAAASDGSSQATMPLPLAALVSLTITYKTDKDSKRYLDLAKVALASIAAGCPWPCMPIVYSLWTQKAKRWSAYFVFSGSRTVFLQHRDAFVQLLKSCFTATLGLHSTPLSYNGGIGALLGHGIGSHIHGRVSPVAPAILYLHAYPYLSDIVFLNKEIVSLLMHSVREITGSGFPIEGCKRLKTAKNVMIQGKYLMDSNLTRVKLVASLAASLVWLSGGLGLVQSLFKEFLPSWFVSVHSSRQEGEPNGVAWLKGYVVAYFASLCGGFVWGVDSSSWGSKRRPKILGTHMEFLARALNGQISLGCDETTWRSYVLGFISLMVVCMPTWMLEVDVDVLKTISKNLRQWNEEELALDLLGIGGVDFMGAAAEMIIQSEP
ncbi:PREDICTED: mediator of RNA polymerase II transcription subunit 33A [Prunus mume]|uniref:Mediator of RNA polymerase II transcription subunit 33A n=1 Tax=Prunus mume TaxID=102107 RepID=A0ABM1LJJ1_PRUMU|nr:PREDICTED: mediator of RNA polymerase II transcription subunit 33A [Prunus mume]